MKVNQMEIMSVTSLTKAYGDKVLFNQLTFSIERQERIGLVGVNGTGKSTFLKILAKREEPDQGTIHHAKDFTVSYLAQDPELDPDHTILDEVFTGESSVMRAIHQYESALFQLTERADDEHTQEVFTRAQEQMDQLEAWDVNTMVKTMLTKLGIDRVEQKIAWLSGGQKKRVALAKALIQPADLLILDEPTNHLDHSSIEWLEKFLPTYQGTVLLVTHDRYFLNRVTNCIYELDHGQLYRYSGNYQTYLEQKAERLRLAKQDQQKHANTLKREMAWLRRGAKARSTKQKARIERIEGMKQQTFNKEGEQLEISVGSSRLGKQVIELNHIVKSLGDQIDFQPFSFLIKPGDRIGIIGENGSGKTTLLNMIAGQISPDQGEIKVGSTVRFGYYQQNHQEMDQDLRIIEYIRETAELIYTPSGESITAEQMLERFLFPRAQQWTFIRRLSGGEKRRLYLLKVLMSQPNVLLLDEPTNDLDTQTLAILEDYLDAFPGVVITVSHDRFFLDRVVDQLIYLTHSEIKTFYGNYSEFLSSHAREEKQVNEQKKSVAKPKPKRKKLSYHEQKEWETIEDVIGELETAIEVEKQSIIQAGADADRVQEHYQQQLKLESELNQKLERWEELSLRMEE
ncbi:ABC-F family ATP-binding cassette domain-containing protein [Amphibacillus sediminis]|uniref:ABC-F family ATP-binding cassette domain-containing protein n=1 Tax=Amphibacillus sediminis TaxID=360185 RepID=UPI0024807EBB|nr:ABC-F family ATP-binding cassette domain-containing protein [Amphibacillus sediminis]